MRVLSLLYMSDVAFGAFMAEMDSSTEVPENSTRRWPKSMPRGRVYMNFLSRPALPLEHILGCHLSGFVKSVNQRHAGGDFLFDDFFGAEPFD